MTPEQHAAPTRRARRGESTESAFIQAATELFAERGFHGTSIADLAAALSLTTASLYYHVTSKQELLTRVLEAGMTDFLVNLETIAASDATARDKLRAALENHLDFVLHRSSAVRVFLRERRFLEPPYRDEYEARVDRYDTLFSCILSDALAAGDFPDVDPLTTRMSILGMINWVVEWYDEAGQLSREKIKESILSLVMDRMLATTPARLERASKH